MPRGRPKRKSEEKIEAFVKKQTKNEFEQVEIFPNEIWLKIINYLSTMDIFQKFALVCKHFQALTLDGSAIKYLELMGLPKKKKMVEKLMEILKKSKSVKEIKMSLNLGEKSLKNQNELMNQYCLQVPKSKQS